MLCNGVKGISAIGSDQAKHLLLFLLFPFSSDFRIIPPHVSSLADFYNIYFAVSAY
jgi:hypothetical protein